MSAFSYRARDRKGALVRGVLEGTNSAAIEDALDRIGLIPIDVAPLTTPMSIKRLKITPLLKKITGQDLIIFSRQLATLFGAGVPLTKALSTLERQITSTQFVEVVRSVREDIEGGSTFAAALSRHPKVFGELYSSMVEVGETGGILDEVLDRLAYLLEKASENRAKIKSATLYPKIVVGAIFFAVVFLMWFVVPKFSHLYANFNLSLPLPTKMLIALSGGMIRYWYLIVSFAVVVMAGLRLYRSTGRGRQRWDGWIMKIPVFGPIILKNIMSRFARVLGSLYKSGLPMLQSLDIVSRAVENRVISLAVKEIEAEVRGGNVISEQMAKYPFFPPMVIQMVAVGEETGGLDEMLEKVAQYYDQEVDSAIRNLTTSLEPVLLAVIFGMVLFLALAIFLPMWDMVRMVR